MAEKLCELKKKGGGGGRYKETSLWTNSAPTSNFSGQNVTLSDNIDNYKYVSIKYRGSVSVADEANVIVSVSDLKKSVGHNSTNHIAIETGAQYSSGTIVSRMVTYVNSTTIGFSMAYQLNSATSNAGWCIPLEILGLNELDHGKKFDETVLWQNPSPNTRMPASDSTASVNVTLSDSLSNYDYVKFVFKRNNGAYADVYTDVIYSVEEFKKYLAGTAYVFRGSIAAFAGNTGIQIIKKFSYVDDTTVMFVHTMSGTNSAGSYTQIIYDETLIPNQIIGCKFR